MQINILWVCYLIWNDELQTRFPQSVIIYFIMITINLSPAMPYNYVPTPRWLVRAIYMACDPQLFNLVAA